jgi:hypothetical protein
VTIMVSELVWLGAYGVVAAIVSGFLLEDQAIQGRDDPSWLFGGCFWPVWVLVVVGVWSRRRLQRAVEGMRHEVPSDAVRRD